MSTFYRRKSDGAVLRWSGRNYYKLLDNKCPNLKCKGNFKDSPNYPGQVCDECSLYLSNEIYNKIIAEKLGLSEEKENNNE